MHIRLCIRAKLVSDSDRTSSASTPQFSVSDMAVIPTLQFPAMERLIKQLPPADLLVLSGFLRACVSEHIDLIITSADELRAEKVIEQGNPGLDHIEQAAAQIMHGSNRVMALIEDRLAHLAKAKAASARDNEMRKKLQKLFPNTPF